MYHIILLSTKKIDLVIRLQQDQTKKMLLFGSSKFLRSDFLFVWL